MAKKAHTKPGKTAQAAYSELTTTTSKADHSPQATSHDADDRQRLIAESAYYLAEQRGFRGDLALEDWLRAEAEVDARLNA